MYLYQQPSIGTPREYIFEYYTGAPHERLELHEILERRMKYWSAASICWCAARIHRERAAKLSKPLGTAYERRTNNYVHAALDIGDLFECRMNVLRARCESFETLGTAYDVPKNLPTDLGLTKELRPRSLYHYN